MLITHQREGRNGANQLLLNKMIVNLLAVWIRLQAVWVKYSKNEKQTYFTSQHQPVDR